MPGVRLHQRRRDLSLCFLKGTKSEKEMTMRRKTVRLVVMLALVLLTAPLAANAQPSTKVYRIGYVTSGPVGWDAQGEAFKQRLRELGYTEGQNLIIEARFAHGKVEPLAEFAAELVQLKVDCIVSRGVLATRAAKQATSTIPIVMINASDDPVRQGLIPSLDSHHPIRT